MDTLDGIRAVQEDGSWCLVLPEDDQACLTLYAEASDAVAALNEAFAKVASEIVVWTAGTI